MIRRQLREFLFGSVPLIKGSFPYYGATVYFPPRSHVFVRACREGTYEHENLKLLLTLMEPDGTFIDIGANIGLMSLPILYTFRDARVMSFEPSPSVLPYLQRTWEESKYKERWVILGEAASDRVGSTEFFLSPSGEDAFDGIRDTHRTAGAKSSIVPVTTLDAVWRSHSEPRVCAVKIDVEGGELNVLKGGRSLLHNCRPYVLLEWSGPNLQAHKCEPEALLEFAAEEHFAVFSAQGFFRVADEQALNLAMRLGENLLLVPPRASS